MKKNNNKEVILCEKIRSNGLKCKKNVIKGSTFCDSHEPNNICVGLTFKGIKCGGRKMKNSNFCCEEHNPEYGIDISDPVEFRIDNLRTDMLAKVMFMRKNTDTFTDQIIQVWKKPIDEYQLDHIFELNLARDAFDKLKTNLKEEESISLDSLKNSIKITMNQEFNLAITETTINLKKSSAVQKFAKDYRKDEVKDDGIRFYLRESFKMLTRTKVSRICEELETSAHAIMEFMDKQEYVTELEKKYIDEIDAVFRYMKI